MATWEAGTSDSVSRGKVAFDMYVVQTDEPNNRSLVRVAIGIFDNNGSYGGYGTGSWDIGLNGGQVNSGSIYYDFSGGGPGWIWSGDFWVGHNADGSRYVSGWASFSGSSPVGSATASGGFSLTDYVRAPYAPGAPSLARTAGTGTVTVTSQTADGRGLGITDYNWQYSTDGVNWSGALGMGTGRVSTLTASLGVTYWVRTRAASSEGWSGWSAATTIAIPNTPAAPATISATRTGRNVAVSCGIADGRGATVTGYRVQYSTDNGATWSTPQTMTGQSYTYSQLPAAKTYIFRCYAVNEMGNGLTRTSSSLWVPAGGMVGVNGAWVYASNVYVGVNGAWVPASNVKVGSAGQWVNAN